jgi:hypothetical protein
MARTKARLGEGVRLADYLSASLLARVYPSAAVNDLLDEYGCNSQRIRRFPASAVAYYCMALSLYPEAAYEEVFAAVTSGLAWMNDEAPVATVAKSSISEARSKLAWQVLQQLQARSCGPLARVDEHPQCFYRGLRLVAMDGSNLEVADESANAQEFGYPGSRTGHAGYPQAQCGLLIECGTHAVMAANLGRYRDSEWQVCAPLLRALNSTMLCLADRGFSGYEHWQAAKQTGAQLLWRAVNNRQLPVKQELSDGSYLSVIYPSDQQKRRVAEALTVRVIEYALPKVPDAQPRYRLITTLLDPKRAPAEELAALYHARWEVEGVLDELKVHLRQNRRVLRSKTPDLVRQEFYGWVLAHYAVRWLIHGAASDKRADPLELSFVAHVHLLRRAQPQSGAFPPTTAAATKTLVRPSARSRRDAQVHPKSKARKSKNGQATKLSVPKSRTRQHPSPTR